VCSDQLPFAAWWGVSDVADVVSRDEDEDEGDGECGDEPCERGELFVVGGKNVSFRFTFLFGLVWFVV
jgi:hypothetical protein